MKFTIGTRIKEARNNAGLNQSDLAKLIQVSPSAIGMYEQNRREPDCETIIKIARSLNVTTDYLLGNDLVEKTSSKNENPLTQHEQAVITAYRNNPSMQTAVDKLLGIEEASFGGTPSTKKLQPEPVSVSHH